MNNHYHDPWSTYDAGGYGLDDTDEHPTFQYPQPGSAMLVIHDKYEPLFTSATWTLEAKVNNDIIASSMSSNKPHSEAFIKRWSRQVIRTNSESLKRLGVDIDKIYVEMGGSLDDLSY